jgi:hypothetical protein
MIRIFAISLVAGLLASCGGGPPSEVSNASPHAIDSDIAAAHDQGPTASSQNPAQISILPTVTVPFRNAE